TGIKTVYELEHVEEAHQINQALKATLLHKRDRDYIVKDGEVIIVDEFTGRQMPGRRWSDGLHQAVEAKEGVKVQQENQPLATITFQNFFRLYHKLAGMTGTAVTEAEEFHKIYKLEVLVIPTHRPMVRTDNSDVIYKNEAAKFNAVVDEIVELNRQARPVLVGTVSIDKCERLARLLEKRGVPREVLNAKQHEREAVSVAGDGRSGLVSRQIEGAQTKVEGHNFDARRYVVEYDDVMNKQREIIYGDRRKILEGESMKETVLDMIKKVIGETVPAYCESRHRDNWDLEGLVEHLRLDFPLPPYAEIPPDELGETPESVADRLYQY